MYMLKRSTILLLSGSLVGRPAWLAGIFLLAFALAFWYRKLYRPSQLHSIRRVELYRTWVSNEVARLQPYQSVGYTTGQDTVTWLKTSRKRITVQEYTYTEIQHNEIQTTISFDQIPKAITNLDLTETSRPLLSLVNAWDNTTQNALEDENTEAEKEGPWLPVVNNIADYEGRTIAPKYIHTVELILDRLRELKYKNFAFDCIEGRANLREYLGAAHQRKFPCDYGGYSSSPSWRENMSTFCSIFPAHFLDYLKDNGGHWLIQIPEFSLDTARVCLAYTFPWEVADLWSGRRPGAGGLRQPGTWRHWQPDGLAREHTDSQDAPCLYVMSVGPRHVRLLFENMSRQLYHKIENGLRNNNQGHRLDCCYLHESTWDVELHLGLIQKVLSTASEGALATYYQRVRFCKSGPIYEGSYTMYSLDDSKIGSLIIIEENSSDWLCLQAKPPVIDGRSSSLTCTTPSREGYFDIENQLAKLVSNVQMIKKEEEEATSKKESHERRKGDEQEKKSEKENRPKPITTSKSGKENNPKPITTSKKSEEEIESTPITTSKKSEEGNKPTSTTTSKKSEKEIESIPTKMLEKSRGRERIDRGYDADIEEDKRKYKRKKGLQAQGKRVTCELQCEPSSNCNNDQSSFKIHAYIAHPDGTLYKHYRTL